MPNEIDLRDYFDILIRRWKFIIGMVVLAVLAAALVTFALKPTYQATATIALAPSTVSISLANQLPPYYLMVDSPRRLPTAYTPAYYIAILQGADVLSAVSPRADFSVAADGNDRALLRITATGGDAQNVAAAANSFARAGAKRLQQLIVPNGDDVALAQTKFDDAQRALDKFLLDNKISDLEAALNALAPEKRQTLVQLARARDLAESVYLDFAREFAKSEILADSALRPTVVPANVPTVPVSPRLTPNLLMGAAFGLLLGIVGAFVLEFLAGPPRK